MLQELLRQFAAVGVLLFLVLQLLLQLSFGYSEREW